jgi:hypothetical protein
MLGPRAIPGSATLLYLLDEANAESTNAGGCYVSEPRPTNAFEDENDDEDENEVLRAANRKPD